MSQLSILCYLMQWREKADQTRVRVTCYLLCQRQVVRAAGFSVVKKDSECKYSERECWEVAPDWWGQRGLKKDQPPHCTLLPPHFPAKIREERVIKRTGQPCPRRCSPACTLASRVKSNILVINVTIKLLHREIWRFIFSLYMKKSDILAINVIIKLPKMGIWRLIFSQYMKK